MAEQIQRTMGPQPIAEQNGAFSWTIPLNAMPSREWLKLFNTPLELTGACMPSLVGFRQRDMVFTAREEQVAEWVKCIDQWMATANAGVMEAEARRGQTADRQQRGVEATKTRLTEADKYRTL